MNIMEHVRNHKGLAKGIVTVGFLTGLAISGYSSAYSSYTGVTSSVKNTYALNQKKATVYYTKEPQRVLQWNSLGADGDIVGKKDSTKSDGTYCVSPHSDGYSDTFLSEGAWDTSYESEGVRNVDSSVALPINNSGKVHRVKITKDYSGTYIGAWTRLYWKKSDGTVQRYLESGKKYVLCCYAKGKGKWIIGSEQDDLNKNNKSNIRSYSLNENSWTKVEQVFTATDKDSDASKYAFIQYALRPSSGNYCDVSDVFVAEVDNTAQKSVLNPIGEAASGSDILGFQGWATTPDRCGLAYTASDSDYSKSDIVPVEGKVYYPVVKRCAIDVNSIIDDKFDATSPTKTPATLSLTINGVKVADHHHGDIFTDAPAGSTYSLTVDSSDEGYRFKGLESDSYGIMISGGSGGLAYLTNYKTNINPASDDIYEQALTTMSGKIGDANYGLNLRFFKNKYDITWDFDGGHAKSGVTYKTDYSTNDDDYSVPIPEKAGMGFAGWTWENLTTGEKHSTSELLPKIRHGTTGDLKFTAHWGEPVTVSCEDWEMDYDGNPLKKSDEYEQTYCLASGIQVNAGDLWGTSSNKPAQLSVQKTETITVSPANHVARKLCLVVNTGYFRSIGLDSSSVPIQVTFQVSFKNKAGNVIHSQTISLNGDWWSVSQMFPEYGYRGSPGGYSLKVISNTPPKDPNKVAASNQNYRNALRQYELDSSKYSAKLNNVQLELRVSWTQASARISGHDVTLKVSHQTLNYKGTNYRIAAIDTSHPVYGSYDDSWKSKFGLYIKGNETGWLKYEDVVTPPTKPVEADYHKNDCYSLVSSKSVGVFSYYANIDMIWDKDSGSYNVTWTPYTYVWSESNHEFVDTMNFSLVSSAQYTIYDGGSSTPTRVLNINDFVNSSYAKHTKIVESGATVPSGYRYIPNRSFGWYNAGIYSNNPFDDLLGCIHVEGLTVVEDAYGVKFDANGGIGSMLNQRITNSSSDRKLRSNEFVYEGHTFKGWATSKERADAGTVDYTDNAQMPVESDLTKLATMRTLYAVWG